MALRHFIIAAASLAVLWSHASAASPSAEELDEQKLIKGTVEILNNKGQTAGTGFLITEKGHILTAEHVIANTDNTVKVKLYDQEKPMNATVLSSSTRFDLALLLIIPEQRLPTIPIGDSSIIKRTDNLWIIGHPAADGKDHKFRLVTLPVMEVDDRGVILVNGDLRPGNSGGPAINSKGEVIGIVLKKSLSLTEASILPILFARHFLESCGIWISQGRVASYGTELEGINKQLATYKAMLTFLKTDLKWEAEIITQNLVDLDHPEIAKPTKALKIWYEKKFEDQSDPKRAIIKLFPVASKRIDKPTASKYRLDRSQEVRINFSSGAGVWSDLDSAINAAIYDYNKSDKPTDLPALLKFDDVHAINVEITPLSEDGKLEFSKASFSLSYGGTK